MAWRDGPQADAVLSESWVAVILTTVFSFHWLITRSSCALGFQSKITKKACPLTTQGLQEHTEELCELDHIFARSWFLACRYLVHIHLLPLCGGILQFQRQQDLLGAVWLVLLWLAYGVFLLVSSNVLQATPKNARFTCNIIYGAVLGCLLASGGESKDSYVTRRDFLMRCQIILAVVFPDRAVLHPHAIIFLAGYVGTTVLACGFDGVGVWFWEQQAFQIILTCVILPTVTVNIHRERIEAFIKAENSDSLVSAFRSMLKGVCDCNLLLDSNAHICGTSTGLQRLLGTQEDLTGRKFSEFIVEDKRYMKLEDFLVEPTASGGNDHATPRCMRVALKGSGRHVPVDVFHVSLPKRSTSLGSSSDCHLLALIEDADARLKAEVEPNTRRPTSSYLQVQGFPGHHASDCQSSTCSEVEVFEELSQITLLLDCSTELFDISEAHLRFSRVTNQSQMKLGMPTLKRFVRPLDWPALKTKLFHYASAVTRPQALSPVMLRLPGEPRKYLRARGVSIKSVFSGFRPRAQPTYLHLTLNKFQNAQRQMSSRPMEGVHEDPSEDQHAGSQCSCSSHASSSSAVG